MHALISRTFAALFYPVKTQQQKREFCLVVIDIGTLRELPDDHLFSRVSFSESSIAKAHGLFTAKVTDCEEYLWLTASQLGGSIATHRWYLKNQNLMNKPENETEEKYGLFVADYSKPISASLQKTLDDIK